MKFYLSIILILLLAIGLSFILPWWSLAIAAFVVECALGRKMFPAFVSAFLAGLVFWGAWSLWIDYSNSSIMSNRMAGMIGLEGGYLLIIITMVLGGLVSGASGWAGQAVRNLFNKPSEDEA